MLHLGDITKINGAEAPIVDVICGGSPCQDLSVAGLRKGLQHSSLGDGETTRSGLFMEQIRIIKEMRDECIRQLQMRGSDFDVRLVRPRYMVWENVQGAFSSNKGEDFRCVLEETAKIVDKDAVIPGPAKGKWPPAGCIISDNYSLAWRTHDSQFWGVPQRRKRICLLADFNGQSAPDILFEYVGETADGKTLETVTDIGTQCRPEVSSVGTGVCRDIEQSGEERKEVAGAATDSTGTAISFVERAGKPGGGKGILIQNERTGSLQTNNSQAVCSWDGSQTAPTLTANNADGSQRMPDKDNFNAVISFTTEMTPKIDEEGTAFSLRSRDYKDPQSVTYQETTGALCASGYDKLGTQEAMNDMYVLSHGGFMVDADNSGVAHTLQATDHKDPQVVCIEGNGTRESHRGDGYKESETMYTLNTVEQHGVCVPETIDVEMEVSVRKYEVDKEKLKECLRTHRNMPIQTIAERLDRPKTLVEHWFRTDDSFAIPDPDVWMNLKALLGIDTDEFDKSIMTFETKPGNYDMRNRIHMGEVSPTLSTQGNDLHCVSYGVDSYNQTASEEVAETIRTNGGGDNLPKVAVAYGVDCYNQTMSEEQSKSLTCSATDSDHVPCVTYGIDRASFNQGQNAQFDFSVEKELSPTIVSKGPGGGTNETVGALCARDYKGVGSQYVSEGKVIVQETRSCQK